MLELGEDAEELREHFLTWRIVDLQKQLEKYRALPLPELEDKKKISSLEEPDIDDMVFDLNSKDLNDEKSPLDDPTKVDSEEEIELSESEIHYQRTSLYLQQLINGFFREVINFVNAYGELFVKNQPENAKGKLQRSFTKVTNDLFESFSEVYRDHMLTQKESKHVIQCLELLAKAFEKLDTADSEMNIPLIISSVLSDTVKSFMQHQLDECISSISKKISDAEEYIPNRDKPQSSSSPNSAASHCDELTNEMLSSVQKFISGCGVSIINLFNLRF